MKLVVVVLLIMARLYNCQDEEINADLMVQYIRNRGTFLASLVNMTERIDNTEDEVKKEALNAYRQLMSINFGAEYALKVKDDEYNYYDNSEVELPLICNPDKNAELDKSLGAGTTNTFL